VKTTSTLPGEYSLSIDSSVQGIIHPVRKLPAVIKPKAVEKLKEMEKVDTLLQSNNQQIAP
jgi:hypothetical protein